MTKAIHIFSALALILSSCGSDDASNAGVASQRLELKLQGEASSTTSDEVRLITAAEHASWMIDAESSHFGKVGNGEGNNTQCLFLNGIPRRVWIPIQEGERFNEVHLSIFAPSSERIALIAMRDQKPVAKTTELLAPRSRTPSTLTFSMPELDSIGAVDTLVVDFLGGTTRPGLVSAELRSKSAASFFPDPSEGAMPLVLSSSLPETRTGYALSAGRELEVKISLKGDEVLRFEHGAPSIHGSQGQGRLAVEAEYSDNTLLRSASGERGRMTGIPKGTLWKSFEMSLSGATGETTISFSLEDTAEGAVHLIANPRVVPADTSPQTVLLITSDTHRADHLGTHAYGLVKTPALVGLAERGVLFEDTFCATNITNPSHMALLTGLEVRDHQIVNNGTPITRDAATLAEAFQAAGWRTLGCVSVNHLSDKNSGLGQGFDRLLSPPDSTRSVVETMAELKRAMSDFEGEPLFCWLHVFDAHSPYEPPAPFDRAHYSKTKNPRDPAQQLAYSGKFLPVSMRGVTDMEWPVAQYKGEIDFLDTQLATLFELPRFQEGVIAFTADHGECFGAHGVYWDHAGVYPDTVHVPLIMSWPGAPKGERTLSPVRQLDVGRTLLNLAGLEGAPFPGRDLRWAIDTPEDTRPRFALSSHGYSASLSLDGWFCVLNLRGHQSTTETRPFIAHSVELYHREVDLACSEDLLQLEPTPELLQRAKQMRTEIIDWLSSSPKDGLGGATDASNERVAALAALGYAGEEGARAEGEAWFPIQCTSGVDGASCEHCSPFD
ncbi:MAG: sulfatase [Planctomycetota bacterium]|nr:sulfatase [Planctomycetota bacterium]